MSHLLALLLLAPLVLARPQEAPPLTPAPAAPKAKPPAPTSLLEPPFPADARFGVALARAAGGEIEAGEREVKELVAALGATPEAAPGATGAVLSKERLERESARLAALAKARREFLERCVAEKKKFKVEPINAGGGGKDAKPVACTVTEVSDERFVLVDPKGVRQEVAIATLTPELLLKRMSELKLEAGAAATRAYAGLLAGRKSWAKAIDGASDADATALRADAPEYADRLATGAAVLALQELAAMAVPPAGTSDVAAFDAPLAAIRALVRDHRREALVAERNERLKKLATQLLVRRFDAGGLASAELKGGVEQLPDGNLRLTYEFKLPAELEDFVRVESIHPSWSFFEIKRPLAETKQEVKDGALRLVGQGCLRHRLELDAPVSATFDVVYGMPDPKLSPSTSLRVALCDDGRGSMVTNLDLKCVEVHDAGRAVHKTSSKDDTTETLTPEQPYTIKLEHDGRTAKLQVAERKAQEVAAPTAGRKGGGVAIYWKSDAPVALQRIVFEGRLAAGALRPLREAAVARDLKDLFGE